MTPAGTDADSPTSQDPPAPAGEDRQSAVDGPRTEGLETGALEARGRHARSDPVGLPDAPERIPLTRAWKTAVGIAVAIAAMASGAVGAALARLSCEGSCVAGYAGGAILAGGIGGVGMLILGVLLARSMQEFAEYQKARRAG